MSTDKQLQADRALVSNGLMRGHVFEGAEVARIVAYMDELIERRKGDKKTAKKGVK